MERTRIAALSGVTEAVYQREHQKLKPLLEQEARVMRRLAQLDAQTLEVRQQTQQSSDYRVSGGDVVWHTWESITRRDLNIELARIRAQKLAALDAVRQAFGRMQAVEELVRNAAASDRKRRQKSGPELNFR